MTVKAADTTLASVAPVSIAAHMLSAGPKSSNGGEAVKTGEATAGARRSKPSKMASRLTRSSNVKEANSAVCGDGGR
jgi:hypothetical protein